MNTPKETSFSYGKEHQKLMLDYYRKSKIVSDDNTEYLRVVLAENLMKEHALPRFPEKKPSEIIVVDVGCSVGLFALEYAKKGYNSYGVDFDESALEIAEKLNEEEKTNAKFIQMDVSDWNLDNPIDIAICFDIFEHLHDDELGSLLVGMKKKFSVNGCLVFHTLPSQYDYIFWNEPKGIINFPKLLRPFRKISPSKFEKLIKIYALLKDVKSLAKGRLTHKESIKMDGHCNPLTIERLKDIFERAGYEITFMESGFLGEVQLDKRDRKYFHKQPITHRSLRGVAVPKKKKP